MSRALVRVLPRFLRNEFPELRLVNRTPFGYGWMSPSFGSLDREFRQVENMMDRMQSDIARSFSEFFPNGVQSQQRSSMFRLVEEDGKKKVRVQFDATGIKPEDIEVKTSGNELEIRARQEEKGEYHSIYQEYSRRLTLPEGVKAEELSCKFDDGLVTLEAPYTPPAIEAKPEEGQTALEGAKEIPIKHEGKIDATKQAAKE
ncbi:major egg antigen-like [Paramacrobiotus metropolitanus]|uniref:major egg antigen-like n=1 Tax=Paramacrobiotus metropolitanus TaxID=2943436 RepID=UPI002445E6D9|nr:major egg antigen-like [Paramacrobiotus metropolitanus]